MIKEIAAGVGLLIAVPFLYWSWTSDDLNPPKPEPTQLEVNLSNARFSCREAIKQALHDPGSAELGAIWNWPAALERGNENTILVQPVIRATNGFGAKVQVRFQCEFDVLPDDQGIKLTDVQEY